MHKSRREKMSSRIKREGLEKYVVFNVLNCFSCKQFHLLTPITKWTFSWSTSSPTSRIYWNLQGKRDASVVSLFACPDISVLLRSFRPFLSLIWGFIILVIRTYLFYLSIFDAILFFSYNFSLSLYKEILLLWSDLQHFWYFLKLYICPRSMCKWMSKDQQCWYELLLFMRLYCTRDKYDGFITHGKNFRFK